MLCGELQPLGADMPILIGGAEAPCAKGLLNPGDDAHHGVIHRVARERLGLDGPWRLLVFQVDEVNGRGRHFGGLACLEKVDVLQVVLVASVHRTSPMHNIAGWREIGEEMAGNSGVFIKRHQLMET